MSAAGEFTDVPFVLIGDILFAPEFLPNTIRVRKVRNLDRTEHFCKGEDVADDGSENREIHVTGKALGNERQKLDQLADSGEEFDMTSATWTGEVMVSEVEYEGPVGYHPPTESHFFDYTLDLVETGPDREVGSGIVTEGFNVEPPIGTSGTSPVGGMGVGVDPDDL